MGELCEGQMEEMATNNIMVGASKHFQFPRSYLLLLLMASTKALSSLPSSYQWKTHSCWQKFLLK